MPYCQGNDLSKGIEYMDFQTIFVAICIMLALLFMCRKVYRTLKRRSCACDCESARKGQTCCSGDCAYEKQLRELQPPAKTQ